MTPVAPSFEQLVDVAREYRAYARMRRRLHVMYAVAGILIAVAVICTVVPLLMQYASQTSMSASTSSVEQQVRLWPESRIDDELRAARAYNRDLARSGQPVLGAQADPFSNGERLSSQSAQDQRYGRLLNEGHGIMGRVSIPKISVDLPIYHGTGDKQLSLGSGHLYGTSLPVGGNNTHAVITGHRGMVQAQMFTRLDEMREGDFIYISTMNRTLAYEVDRIIVIEPTDTSQLRIVPGQDRLTLMTCTPYGVNTHRLLISGHRVAIPMPAPEPNDVLDARNIALGVGLGILAAGLFIIWLARRHKAARIIRHGAFWPWMRRKGESANDTLA